MFGLDQEERVSKSWETDGKGEERRSAQRKPQSQRQGITGLPVGFSECNRVQNGQDAEYVGEETQELRGARSLHAASTGVEAPRASLQGDS